MIAQSENNKYTAIVSYKGNLRTEAIHVASDCSLITDAPVDNCGKGENFSPTDLLAVSFAACALTIIGIAMEKKQLPTLEINCAVQKIMQNSPRKIKALTLDFSIRGETLNREQKQILEECIWNCPVSLSLDPGIEKKINFTFETL
jgi:uncharacterized OsmC-like protein